MLNMISKMTNPQKPKDIESSIETQAVDILTEELWNTYVDCLDVDSFAKSLEIDDVNDLFNSKEEAKSYVIQFLDRKATSQHKDDKEKRDERIKLVLEIASKALPEDTCEEITEYINDLNETKQSESIEFRVRSHKFSVQKHILTSVPGSGIEALFSGRHKAE